MNAKARNGRGRKAFSLIEVMCNIGIVSVILLAVSSAMVAMFGSFRSNEQVLRTRQSATVAMEFMLGYIRQAKEIDLQTPMAVSVSSNRVVVMDYRHPTDPAQDQLRTFSYDAATGELRMAINNEPAKTVLRNVTHLSFRSNPEYDSLLKRLAVRSVTVDMILTTRDVAGKPVPITFSGTSYARSVPLL